MPSTVLNRTCALVYSIAFSAILVARPSAATATDWPQWLGPQRDGVWREGGLLDRFPPGGPKVRWCVPAGAGYAGPAVSGNRIYLMDYVTKGGAQLPANGFARGS